MEVFNFSHKETGVGVALFSGECIFPEAFERFEPVVSQKILRWMENERWPAPGGMEVTAIIRIAKPEEATRWHYDDDILDVDVTPPMWVVDSNHVQLWLRPRGERLALKVVDVFHHEIVAADSGEKLGNLKKSLIQRSSANLAMGVQSGALKIQRLGKEMLDVQNSLTIHGLMQQVMARQGEN